jgi:peptidoglycan/xylan/chitin deacetylase (PgdA/CDA1 family)
MLNIKMRAKLLVLLLLLLNACSANRPSNGVSSVDIKPAPTQPTSPLVVATSIPFSTSTSVPIIASTETALSSVPPPTLEPARPSPTPWLVRQGPGTVVCPILVYHNIAIPKVKSPYYVPPEEFRQQMQALKNWGYATITASTLVQAINFGADLPARPIVITFDDDDETVYSQAFPIMQEFGFVGVNYVVVNYIGVDGYMNVDQLKQLAAAGWETGSHSMDHADLTKSNNIEWEMQESRYMLGKLLKVPVATFAYPFGKANSDMYTVLTKNYQAGMGLGVSFNQRGRDLYYLWRRPVEMGVDMQTFASYLPWNTPPAQ